MSKKDEASPRQRQIMEKRWENARKACGEGSCHANYRFHVAGCERRAQKVKVTNLNTGVTSEATIVHSDVRAVKGVLADHDKQAVHLEPVIDLTQEEVDNLTKEGRLIPIPEEVWSDFERGQRAELFEPRIIPVPKPEDTRALTSEEQAIRDTLLSKLEREMLPAPARPWWKFWGRRG